MSRFDASEYATWLGFVILAGIVFLFFTLLGNVSESQPAQQAESLQRALENAVVQCYALEGAYPPDIAYLKNYGIEIDESRFTVFYEARGANLRPALSVDLAFAE